MMPATPQQIKTKATVLSSQNANWHFHILTPECIFNTSDRYAFVLEDLANKQALVYYSEVAEKPLGEELAPLLHGADILSEKKDESFIDPIIERMVARAKELNQSNIEWHHHVLFPGCQFNNEPSKYTLILEDPSTGERLESLSDNEPYAALRHLEREFYRQ